MFPRNLLMSPAEMLDRIGSVEGALRTMARAVPQMAEDLRRVRITIEPQFETVSRIDERLVGMQQDLVALRETITRLERTAEQLADKAPDPAGPGPIARARDALTSTQPG